jgi:hypothetical protein
MENTSTAMVSRSLRLHKDTLAVLKKEADKKGLGITVYIRSVLEALVDNINQNDLVVMAPFGEDAHYPEI